MKKPLHFIITICLFFVSCTSTEEYPYEVERSLAEAGTNASELEKVLQHYRQDPADSLKYRAACFLIEHMPAHRTYQGAAIDSFYQAMERIFALPGGRSAEDEKRYAALYDSVLQKWGWEIGTTLAPVEDVQTLAADYLIRNIEEAFAAWQQPWSAGVSFDLFCKYILPYRVGEEPVSNWRGLYTKRKETYPGPRPERTGHTYLYAVCHYMNRDYICNLYSPYIALPEYPLDQLIDIKSGSCREYAYMATAYNRAMGLPVAVDFAPQWGNRSMGHEWNVLLPKEDTPIPFGVNGTLGGTLYDMREDVVAKIYRRTYHINPHSLYARTQGKEAIPPLFRTPCMEDVTGDYTDTASLHVELFPNTPPERKYVYACVFDNQEWQIIQWAEVENGQAVFRGMGRGCVYLPVWYEAASGGYVPAGYPVLCGMQRNRTLRPDPDKRQRMCLTRKYRGSNALEDCAGYLKGGYFQVANQADFRDARTVDSIARRPESRFTRVEGTDKGAFRYFRYVSAPDMHCNVAEIALYGEDGKRLIPKQIYASDGGRENTRPEMAFDGETLNHFMSEKGNGWIAADFGKPLCLSHFYYLPRNDDNFIREGEIYELFYYDRNGWKSLGKQTGSMDGILEYGNTPENALFLLHNHSKGKEERIFTYEEEKQVFW